MNPIVGIKNLTEYIRCNPNDVNAYNNRGREYYNEGKNEKAIVDFDKAIEINPSFIHAYNNRGNVYSKQGNYAQSIIDFNKAIELEPNFAEAYYNRGNIYYKQEMYEKAIADYERAVEIKPDYVEALIYRMKSYYKHFVNCRENIDLRDNELGKRENSMANSAKEQETYTENLFKGYKKLGSISTEDVGEPIMRDVFNEKIKPLLHSSETVNSREDAEKNIEEVLKLIQWRCKTIYILKEQWHNRRIEYQENELALMNAMTKESYNIEQLALVDFKQIVEWLKEEDKLVTMQESLQDELDELFKLRAYVLDIATKLFEL